MFTRKKNLPNLKRLGNVYSELNKQPRIPQTKPLNVASVGNVYNEVKSLESVYDAGIFLDNDSIYIEQLRECGDKMTVHKVRGSDYMPAGYLLTSYEYTNFYNKLSPQGKATANIMKDLILLNSKGVFRQRREYLDIPSGIQEDDVEFVKKWVRDHAFQKLVALFDYDRTLTIMEGGFFLGNTLEETKQRLSQYSVAGRQINASELTIEGFAEYYAGGQARLAMLQQMFDFLYKNEVTIYILTNNGACMNYPQFFQDVVSVYTKGRPVKYICAKDERLRTIGGKDYRGQKRRALQLNANLKQALCPIAGGKRKTKRRHRKH